jgi:hypothetical protein
MFIYDFSYLALGYLLNTTLCSPFAYSANRQWLTKYNALAGTSMSSRSDYYFQEKCMSIIYGWAVNAGGWQRKTTNVLPDLHHKIFWSVALGNRYTIARMQVTLDIMFDKFRIHVP